MKNKEKTLLIGVVKRFNNFFGPWDLELHDHNMKCYGSDTIKFYRAIKAMQGKEFKRELNRNLGCIRLWRKETKKDRGTEGFIDFLTN